MADKRLRVELTARFVDRLNSIESFLAEAGAPAAYEDLLTTLREEVIPNLLSIRHHRQLSFDFGRLWPGG